MNWDVSAPRRRCPSRHRHCRLRMTPFAESAPLQWSVRKEGGSLQQCPTTRESRGRATALLPKKLHDISTERTEEAHLSTGEGYRRVMDCIFHDDIKNPRVLLRCASQRRKTRRCVVKQVLYLADSQKKKIVQRTRPHTVIVVPSFPAAGRGSAAFPVLGSTSAPSE
jgi:hypothetical protein